MTKQNLGVEPDSLKANRAHLEKSRKNDID